MKWYNEPPNWIQDGNTIAVHSAKDTDFWRTTRHDFIADNGHFYFQEVSGDFTAAVKITGEYIALYDQAGLMIRESDLVWLKCGVEYLDGIQQASAVVTRGYSDWSIVPLIQNPPSTWIRMVRIGSAVEVFYSPDGETFTMIRQAYLTETETLHVGLMVATPKGDGFKTVFEDFKIEQNT